MHWKLAKITFGHATRVDQVSAAGNPLASESEMVSMNIIGWFAKLFGKKNEGKSDATGKLMEEWDDEKSRLLEKTLGKEHDMVMHALIPYHIGGSLDLYYYPNGIHGTAVATKELSEMSNESSSNAISRSYELEMFTKHRLSLDDAKDETTAFGRAHSNINAVLNLIARYSETAKLNPNDTCEFPEDMEVVGGKCLIFDGYARWHSDHRGKDFGLLAVIEIFRSEMDYAREEGGKNLIKRLKESGFYPYSDLDREPVA
ncbi:MAG: hypothetical protein ACJ8FY_20595 [Gemmataceae bacterium]